MADWTDGPEYAPTQRPAAFVEPDAAPLTVTDAGSDALSEPAPAAQAPSFAAPEATPLDRLAVATGPQRDPEEPFAVVSSPMTSWSSGAAPTMTPAPAPAGAAPALPGQLPHGLPPAPLPVTLLPPASLHGGPSPWPPAPLWAPPPQESAWRPPTLQGQPPQAPPPTAYPHLTHQPPGLPRRLHPMPTAPRPDDRSRWRIVVDATTPALLITLSLAALVGVLSLPLLGVSAALGARVRYRRTQVGRCFGVSFGLAALLGLLGTVSSYGRLGLAGWYEQSMGWFQVAALVLLAVVPALQDQAHQRSERPETWIVENFRTRDYEPVPPSERPRKTRRGVRVVVTDGEAVLLFTDSDPGIPGSRWWVTPGGGMDPGETEAQTAVRELEEETGLRVQESDLVGPVMRRRAVHGYSDQICVQDECFYVLRTDRFEVDTSGHTPEEQFTLKGSAWVPLGDLATLPEPVWPATLAELVAATDDPARWPGDIGSIEESTVPVED